MAGNKIEMRLSKATRRELIDAITERYRSANQMEEKKILDEFIEVTGFHRKHAIRALRRTCEGAEGKLSSEPKRARKTPYNEAVVQALTILWETADRICGKRFKTMLPTLVESMERHGHLCLDSGVRIAVLEMSAATMDRMLKPVREAAVSNGDAPTSTPPCGKASRSGHSTIGTIRRPDYSKWTWSPTAANRLLAVTPTVWC